jgi:hypothetical protein
MKSRKKALLALIMITCMLPAWSNPLLAALQAHPTSTADANVGSHYPVDPHPEWGNPNGDWIVWWRYNPLDSSWKYFKAYGRLDHAVIVANAVQAQGFDARVWHK